MGYLAPARIRPDLTIRPETTVVRVLANDGRCSGIEVLGPDGPETISARLVVLSAGAIHSPALLSRSGIGAADKVAAIGVDVVADLPGVGQNLSDHPALAISCLVKPGVNVEPDIPIIQTILRYTAPGSDQRNDLQIEQLSFSPRRDGKPAFAIAAVLEQQNGRGELIVDSADPHAAPRIENHFCEDESDADRLATCLLDTLAFARTAPLADMIESIAFPDPAKPMTHEAAKALCRKFSGRCYHPCGTAKMGPVSDPMAVVDQYGRCHGLDQLVVADASIMPAVPRANTNLTSIMIGEMVGEWLRTEPTRYGL